MIFLEKGIFKISTIFGPKFLVVYVCIGIEISGLIGSKSVGIKSRAGSKVGFIQRQIKKSFGCQVSGKNLYQLRFKSGSYSVQLRTDFEAFSGHLWAISGHLPVILCLYLCQAWISQTTDLEIDNLLVGCI